MTDAIRQLLNQIIALAKDRGLTQADLATRAGLTAVGLSKAKHRGDIRASTLAALAEQLDMELTLAPKRTRERATDSIRAGTFFQVTGTPPTDRSGR